MIADVSARAQLGKHLPRWSILRGLTDVNARTEAGKLQMTHLLAAVQRVVFDGHYTLTFFFMSKRASAAWANTELRLRECSIKLQSAEKGVSGTRTSPQVARHYAVKILGTAGLDPILLHSIFSQIAGEPILDIRHAGVKGLAEYDNDYWTVIFAGMDCPSLLLNVTSLVIGDTKIILHHYQHVSSRPCHNCFSPAHLRARCSVPVDRRVELRATRQRRYVGGITSTSHSLFDACVILADLDSALANLTSPPVEHLIHPEHTLLEAISVPVHDRSQHPGQNGHPAASTDLTDASGWSVIRRSQRRHGSGSGQASGRHDLAVARTGRNARAGQRASRRASSASTASMTTANPIRLPQPAQATAMETSVRTKVSSILAAIEGENSEQPFPPSAVGGYTVISTDLGATGQLDHSSQIGGNSTAPEHIRGTRGQF